MTGQELVIDGGMFGGGVPRRGWVPRASEG